ncbi:MAG: rod shape-determining protein RodA [Candidatus Doudnabacteria bacterium RIFCSPHIGHO2_01_FULL_43_23]|uniref:Rod shape-determining protein RodA n=1 Tax=Candidatus Doudnabacteria bacterium RIFCSPHIGHO2_01_FULL_43_23 TaxID=1817822 RepID=A0A1F5NR14_9BACT|nr:MAG: rod shape-determining protein RodA [Candidatus Doudnabacteria bacterium RIFCSPHIGHO2_01_FULL_43_23]
MTNFLILLRRVDKYLLGASMFLVMVGFLMIYSTTFSESENIGLVTRQLVFFSIGLVLFFTFSSLDYKYLRRISVYIYVVGIALLVAVLFFGFDIRGTTRWFDLGVVQLQPVEYMKLALIIMLATFFQRRLPAMTQFKNIIFSFLLTLLPIALVMMQTDLGSAMVLAAIWLGMLLACGIKKQHLLWLVLALVIFSLLVWFVFLADYQKDRVFSFLDPNMDPQGKGYNAIQSITAVGSGGLAGQGFARGIVSQLRFLPERQTDFIFASLAEELGFVGASLLIIIFGFWFFRMAHVIRDSRENFGFFLALGIFIYFFVQSGINIAMNIGLLPITGLPLPLVSYGGSSLIVSLVALGVMENVLIRSQGVSFD